MRNADEQTLPVETHVKTRTLKVRGGAVNTNALGPANNLPVDQPGSSVELDKISVHIIWEKMNNLLTTQAFRLYLGYKWDLNLDG